MKYSIKELRNKLQTKEISAKEIIKLYFDRIKKVEPEINAFITLNEEDSLKKADLIDKKIKEGEKLLPLEGMPCAIKDNILVEGLKCTSASKILNNYVASYDATCIKRLKEQGVIILGKTNLDEFAMGASTESSAYGCVKNPWDLDRVPGGSSGGSAAVVSSGEATFTLGSDTGGSIRQPASFCGVVGLKPTYGRVSRYGLMALASSLDQIGPITNTVEDAAWIFGVISGEDNRDSTSISEASDDFVDNYYPHIKGRTCGVPKEYFGEGIDPKVKKVTDDAIRKLEDLGANVKEVSLPHTKYALACYYIIMPAEASSNLARYDGIKYGFSAVRDSKDSVKNLLDVYLKSRAEGLGEEVKRRIMIGSFVLSSGYHDEYYKKALKVRTKIAEDFKRVYEEVDFLAAPVTPTTAFKIGEKTNDPLSMYMSDILTVSANIAGIPSISVPCGFVDGMPCGMQFMGNYYNEKMILQAAGAYEINTDWHKKSPKNI